MDKTKKLGLWASLFVLAVALVTLAAAAGDVYAAGGGKGHGKPGGATTSTATCSETPNPLSFRTYGSLTGSGFPAYYVLGVSVSGSGGTAMGFVWADATGRFSLKTYGGWLGTNTVTVVPPAPPRRKLSRLLNDQLPPASG